MQIAKNKRIAIIASAILLLIIMPKRGFNSSKTHQILDSNRQGRYLLFLSRIKTNCGPSTADKKQLIASWYSIESLKKEGTWKTSKGVMANGNKFSDESFTCATRIYPLGSILRISRNIDMGGYKHDKNNARNVIVVVTDRIGKRFAETRIDLSQRAFSQIASLEQGIVPVFVERIK